MYLEQVSQASVNPIATVIVIFVCCSAPAAAPLTAPVVAPSALLAMAPVAPPVAPPVAAPHVAAPLIPSSAENQEVLFLIFFSPYFL